MFNKYKLTPYETVDAGVRQTVEYWDSRVDDYKKTNPESVEKSLVVRTTEETYNKNDNLHKLLISSIIDKKNGNNLLDFGCGYGRLFPFLQSLVSKPINYET